MSIFIKTMTYLPEHCYECPCHNGESGYCQADKEHRVSFDRPFWCPLAKTESKPQERNCHFCNHYKDEYCDSLDIKPYCPEKGCDYFEPRDGRIHEICEEIKKLSERIEDIEKQIKKEKEEEIEKLKAELDCTKFHRTLQWKCERCGKLIPYMSDFCHECADEILGDPPKPFDPAEMEEA